MMARGNGGRLVHDFSSVLVWCFLEEEEWNGCARYRRSDGEAAAGRGTDYTKQRPYAESSQKVVLDIEGPIEKRQRDAEPAT